MRVPKQLGVRDDGAVQRAQLRLMRIFDIVAAVEHSCGQPAGQPASEALYVSVVVLSCGLSCGTCLAVAEL